MVCLVTSTRQDYDKICSQNFKENGSYTFNEFYGYFGHIDYENNNMDQGDKRVEDNVPTNEKELVEEEIECCAESAWGRL